MKLRSPTCKPSGIWCLFPGRKWPGRQGHDVFPTSVMLSTVQRFTFANLCALGATL